MTLPEVALAIPDPRYELVPKGWCGEVAAPVIEAATDQRTLDEIEAALRGKIAVVDSLDGDALEYEKAWRFVEARRGSLLGPAQVGRPPAGNLTCVEGLDASEATISRWRTIAEHWVDLLREHVLRASERRKVSQTFLLRLVDSDADRRRLTNPTIQDPDGLNTRVASVAKLAEKIGHGSVDAIITDPPYGKEFLSTIEDLGRTAALILKPGGVCVVMYGQVWMYQAQPLLAKHLRYCWTAAYRTPGAQSPPAGAGLKVNSFWKPLLIFSNGPYDGPAYGDVAKSDTNANEKKLHWWGQSESGMADIVRRFTRPGELVCDPFCGAGTTAVAALVLGRRCLASDMDPNQVALTKGRVDDACRANRET